MLYMCSPKKSVRSVTGCLLIEILFVAPCQNVLGQVPLFPLRLFLDCNMTPTISFLYCQAVSAPAHQISTWHHRFVKRHWQEGKQDVQIKPVALAVWEGQA